MISPLLEYEPELHVGERRQVEVVLQAGLHGYHLAEALLGVLLCRPHVAQADALEERGEADVVRVEVALLVVCKEP